MSTITKQATYRSCEILRFPDASGQAVPSLRMTVSRLEDGGKRRRLRRLLFPYFSPQRIVILSAAKDLVGMPHF
jgi:cytochrome P450